MDIITTKDLFLAIFGAGIGAVASYYFTEAKNRKEQKILKDQLNTIKKYVVIRPIIDSRLIFTTDKDIVTEGKIGEHPYTYIQQKNYKTLKISYAEDGSKEVIFLLSIGSTSPAQNRIEEIVLDLFSGIVPDNVLLYEYNLFHNANSPLNPLYNRIRQFLDLNQQPDKTISENKLKRIMLESLAEIKRQFLEHDGPESLYDEPLLKENLRKQSVDLYENTKEKIMEAEITHWNFRD